MRKPLLTPICRPQAHRCSWWAASIAMPHAPVSLSWRPFHTSILRHLVRDWLIAGTKFSSEKWAKGVSQSRAVAGFGFHYAFVAEARSEAWFTFTYTSWILVVFAYT